MSLSRKLTWILRHGPVEAHVEIDNQGWVDVAQLIASSEGVQAFDPPDPQHSGDLQEAALRAPGFQRRKGVDSCHAGPFHCAGG